MHVANNINSFWCINKCNINLLVLLGCHINIVVSLFLSLVKRLDGEKNSIDSSQQQTDSRRRRGRDNQDKEIDKER